MFIFCKDYTTIMRVRILITAMLMIVSLAINAQTSRRGEWQKEKIISQEKKCAENRLQNTSQTRRTEQTTQQLNTTKKIKMKTIAITNVRVFDGNTLTELKTVVIENGLISSKTTGDIIIDGNGGTLIPGLIDSHIHLAEANDLKLAADAGITTMLDMATHPTSLVDSLRNRPGLTDIRSCYFPASAPGGIQTTKMKFPSSSIVTGPNDAERFVDEQISYGADYIKVVLEDPNIMKSAALTLETVAALVNAAHKKGKQVFAHTTTIAAFQIGVDAGVDILTHTPLGQPLTEELVKTIVKKGIIVVPTMIMMKGLTRKFTNMPTHPHVDFANVQASVQALHKGGAIIIAGTDANTDPGSFCNVIHGVSLHEELELLVDAGLTPVEALQSATSIPAKYFCFTDRGVIESGRRADFVLVNGDPTKDIKAIRNVQGVWIRGERVK
jgi:imidazolonepropionase-like amidohydrolase